MAYSTPSDVRTQTPFKDTTNIPDAYVTQKIAEADGLINAAIVHSYTLPLTVTPDLIKNCSKGIASLLLIKEQDTNVEVQPGVNVEQAWAAQMSILDGISTRKFKLLDTNGNELSLASSALPSYYPNATSSATSTAPKFTMNKKF